MDKSHKLLTVFRAYFALLKPSVTFLVFFTAFSASFIAAYSSESFSLTSTLVGLIAIAIGSGGAGAINMWYDRDIDRLMSRTKSRPIPSGKIKPKNAIIFALLMCALSIFLMLTFVNLVSGLLLAFAIFYYAVLYTMLLKRTTAQNIVIGGAAGAFPPLIGWASVTGQVSLQSIIMFLIIFFWTPPHFWALALKSSKDYKLANIPMLPVVSGKRATKVQIIIYSFLLGLCAFLPVFLCNFGWLYLVFCVVLNFIFILRSFKVYYDESKCMKMFYFSIIYLFLLFGAMIADTIISSSFFFTV